MTSMPAPLGVRRPRAGSYDPVSAPLVATLPWKPGNRAERSWWRLGPHGEIAAATGPGRPRARARARSALPGLAGAGDRADGRGQRQPQPDGHAHGREVAE